MPESEAFVGATGTQLVDFTSFADVDDFGDAVHRSRVVQTDADAHETAHDGPFEKGRVNPLLQFVARQTYPSQLFFGRHKSRLLRPVAFLFFLLCNHTIIKKKKLKKFARSGTYTRANLMASSDAAH